MAATAIKDLYTTLGKTQEKDRLPIITAIGTACATFKESQTLMGKCHGDAEKALAQAAMVTNAGK